jgi:hypothetical protein
MVRGRLQRCNSIFPPFVPKGRASLCRPGRLGAVAAELGVTGGSRRQRLRAFQTSSQGHCRDQPMVTRRYLVLAPYSEIAHSSQALRFRRT